MYLIDGYEGRPHITASQVGDYNIGVTGMNSCVFGVGEQLRAEIVDTNTIRVYDGAFMLQGRRGGIEAGTYETVTIENGTQAQFRNDLIAIKYEKDTEKLTESVSIVVIKGTPGDVASDPEVETGNLRTGDTVCYMPLYRVTLGGINLTGLEQLFTVRKTVEGLENKIDRVSYSSKYGLDVTTLTVSELFDSLDTGDTFSLVYDSSVHSGLAETVGVHIDYQYGLFVAEKIDPSYMKMEFICYADNSSNNRCIYEGSTVLLNGVRTIHNFKLRDARSVIAESGGATANYPDVRLFTSNTTNNTSADADVAANPVSSGNWYNVLRMGDKSYFSDLAFPFFDSASDHVAYRKVALSGGQIAAGNWRAFLDNNNFNVWAAKKIIVGGDRTNGYIRFPDIKKQIAWVHVSKKADFSTAWGNMLEFSDGGGVALGSWSAAFSETPVVAYNVKCDETGAGAILSTFNRADASQAGTITAVRATAYGTSRKWTFSAIGIGSYT